MKISLIGMTGTGKTYWSKKLSEKGFKKFCCDDLIAEKLDLAGTTDMSKWMGQPFEKQHKNAAKLYLALEEEVVRKVLAAVQKLSKDENVVIDTTGSVIYLPKPALKQIANLTTIVYLETPAWAQKQMYETYIKYPKPVIWGDVFRKKKEQKDFDALALCYPELLAYRSKAYKKLADVTLDYNMLRKPNFSVEQFLEVLTNK